MTEPVEELPAENTVKLGFAIEASLMVSKGDGPDAAEVPEQPGDEDS